MRTLHQLFLSSLVATLPAYLLSGCGDDESDKPNAAAGTSGSAGSGGSGGSTGGTGNTDGGGTGGSAGAAACDLSGTGLQHSPIPNPTGTLTLTHDKVWDLSDTTYVADGQVLTIEPCTRIEGTKSPLGTLVVSRGGKLMAVGTATSPILFTGKAAKGSRAPGDWGGLILLGKAPNFQGEVNAEGLPNDPKNKYGGTDAADNSGTLKYIGLLFPGYELSPGNEVNGLTMSSVGTGTTIENIVVNGSADDCFEWFGGTVNTSNIVCQNSDDDMFDTDFGYAGTIKNAFGRHTTAPTEASNGIETGYDQATAITPTGNTHATYQNVTACGFGSAATSVGVGALVRAYTDGLIDGLVATGFDYGVNADKAPVGTIAIKNSVVFGMFANATNQIVNPADDNSKDGNFDELAWFNTAGNGNSTTAPAFTVADCKAAGGPAAAVKTSGAGAFKESATWTDWIPADWWSDN